ncbi:MAG: metallothionein [Candidatus Diapherotrites archaeon]|uniref:Metallothionein n=1 Tax=Candidatus Iainarchaeum sp. TaxID=3101447 RepID=A0A7J4L1T8_9ARCH|nr:metallothionein [Candidatus Diapherotrites archaeon]HIH21545.1 metallothionein [Candidatus Diapherotrites archaeon]HIH33616.1 metallothionein [Candidatus Diapherotrites archaeon]
MFGFGKKCPICGMKVDERTGISKNGKIFCSENCANEFEKGNSGKKQGKGCCCG